MIPRQVQSNPFCVESSSLEASLEWSSLVRLGKLLSIPREMPSTFYDPHSISIRALTWQLNRGAHTFMTILFSAPIRSSLYTRFLSLSALLRTDPRIDVSPYSAQLWSAVCSNVLDGIHEGERSWSDLA